MSTWSWYQQMVKAFPSWEVQECSGNNFVMIKDFEIACGETIMIGVAEEIVFSILHPSGDPMTVSEYIEYQAREDEWLQSNDCCEPLINWYDGGDILVTSAGEAWCDSPMLDSLKQTLIKFREEYTGQIVGVQMRCIDTEDVEDSLDFGSLYVTRNNDGQLLDVLCRDGWKTFVVERFELVK